MVIKITFLDYWHLSSGLSAGAKGDSIVVKDKDNLPYIPAKTIKGLARQMAELSNDNEFIKLCFGDKDNQSEVYFSNGVIDDKTKESIVKSKLQNNLYDEISSTKIDKNGIAETGSLREIEVVIPISLYAKVESIPTTHIKKMQNSLKSIKQMGLNRNRGLGRCKVEVVGEENE